MKKLWTFFLGAQGGGGHLTRLTPAPSATGL